MNRDYFTRPIQGGGRESWDYGNTRLARDRSNRRFHFGMRAYIVLVALAAAAVGMGWVKIEEWI